VRSRTRGVRECAQLVILLRCGCVVVVVGHSDVVNAAAGALIDRRLRDRPPPGR